MAYWQFKLIVTYIMTSLTLATRIENLTTDGYFIAKLLNYEEDDFEGILKAVNDSQNDFHLKPTV